MLSVFFFQAEDGIRDRSPSRGLGDVYKRQTQHSGNNSKYPSSKIVGLNICTVNRISSNNPRYIEEIDRTCLLYTSDAADEEDSVDLGGCRILKKKKKKKTKKKQKNKEIDKQEI